MCNKFSKFRKQTLACLSFLATARSQNWHCLFRIVFQEWCHVGFSVKAEKIVQRKNRTNTPQEQKYLIKGYRCDFYTLA